MRRLFALVMSTLCLAASCGKQNADADELYYFHFKYVLNGRLVERYQGKPEPIKLDNSGWVMDYRNSFSDVLFVRTEQDLLQFCFGYRAGIMWRWYIPSEAIEDGVRYYWDSRQAPVDYMEGMLNMVVSGFSSYPFSFDEENYISGWMSFTRKADDPDVVLRVEFEADQSGNGYTYRIREGRIDFTNKVIMEGLKCFKYE